MNHVFRSLILIGIIVSGASAWSQQPEVGKKAASKYFQRSSVRGGEPVSNETSHSERRSVRRELANDGGTSTSDHYLQIHFGKFLNSQAWEWRQRGKQEDTGEYTLGLTYKFDQWGDFADVNLRVDFNEYKVVDQKPTKMSVMPLVLFPDSSSKFPLYFGAGVGVGIFFKQLEDESTLSLDYQLVLGGRFFDVFENGGFFVETGLKNHIQLLNSGQFNGTYLSAGALFTF